MIRQTTLSSPSRRPLGRALFLSASLLALASVPAQASSVLFSSSGRTHVPGGERVAHGTGLLQLRQDNGATLSFSEGAEFTLNTDDSVSLHRGSVTVAGAGDVVTVVRMPDGVEGRVGGSGNAASFTVQENGESDGHALSGNVTINRGRVQRTFAAGQMWAAAGGGNIRQVVARASQPPVPGRVAPQDVPELADLGEGGPLAAAENGLPVSLGDGLAAAGAASDIVALGRRVDAANGNPRLDTYPVGDLGQLVALAANLQGFNGGRPFPAAQADIIRTYLRYLANGGSGAQFLTAYAGFLSQYLDLIRAGGVPTQFPGASQADINAFLAYQANLGRLAELSARNRVLAEAYLAFLREGGNPNLFASRYTDLVTAYFAFVREGGNPTEFAGASQDVLDSYIAFLASSGLAQQLSADDQQVLADYLASGGFAFAETYAAALAGYFDYLARGGVPSASSTLTPEQLRNYLEALDRSGLFAQLLGEKAGFYAAYLAHLQGGGGVDDFAQLNANIFAGYAGQLNAYFAFLQGGGLPSAFSGDVAQLNAWLAALDDADALTAFLGSNAGFFADYLAFLKSGGDIDLWAGLNANVFAGYAAALDAYYTFLAQGGLPSSYTALTQQQIAAYVAALQAAGATGAFLGGLSDFYTGYLAFLAGGGDPDLFTGLPSLNLPAFASALNAYAEFLAAGGLPGDYTGDALNVLAIYLDALGRSGELAALLGGNADLLNDYFAFLAGGGSANLFAGLPVYQTYVSALQAYFAFLDAGGLPGDYTALTASQIRDYLAALNAAGGFATQLGSLSDFFTAYFAHISAGNLPGTFSGLPVYQSYVAALNAYYAFLAGGGLPGDYTALPLATLQSYLAALNAAGGFGAYSGLSTFFADYFAFVSGGGDPASFAGLPIYQDYVAALNAYYAFLAAGGLPGDYTALTQSQIEAYLAALSGVAGGFASFAGLNTFFTQYYAFIQGGGDPADFAGLPVYADYLAAISAFYAYLAGGGLPSGYTALTQAQIQAYLAILDALGLLAANFQGAALDFWSNYLAFLTGGGIPDEFTGFPVGNPVQIASGHTWISDPNGIGVGATTSVDVAANGVIGQISYASTAVRNFASDGNYTAMESGKIGSDVAWTRFARPTGTIYSNWNSHVLTGAVPTNLPTTGKVDYILVGGTSPTNQQGAAGSVGSFEGSLAVSYGTPPRVGFEMDVYMDNRGWRATTTGGSASPQLGGFQLNTSTGRFEGGMETTGILGAACAAACSSYVRGGLFGDGGSSAGLVYTVSDTNAQITGIAIFGTSGVELDSLGTRPVIPAPVVRPVDQPGSFTSTSGSAALSGIFNSPVSGVQGFRQNVSTGTWALDGANGPLNIAITAGGNYTRNSAQAFEVQGNSRLLIGRWSDGPYSEFNLAANQGAHFLLAAPLASSLMLPTGRVEYNLIGGTSPSSSRGLNGLGTIEASLAIAFGPAPKIGVQGQIVLPAGSQAGYTYSFGSAASLANPNINITIPSHGRFAFETQGSATNGNAGTIYFQGALADEFASQLGFTYLAQLYANNGSGTFRDAINGAVIFGRSDLYPDAIVAGTPPPPPPPPPNGGGTLTGYTGGFDPITPRTYFLTTVTTPSGLIPGGESAFDASSYTVDANGGLLSYTRSGGATRTRGTMSQTDVFGNADVLIGRWADGTNTGGTPFTLNANQGFHYLFVRPTPTGYTLPASGVIHYDLLAATKPTIVDGSLAPGSFTGDMAIVFGAQPKVALEATITMAGLTLGYATTGGIANPQASTTDLLYNPIGHFGFTVPGVSGGANCAGGTNCSFTAFGSIANDVDTLGITYTARHSGGNGKEVIGAAIFGNGTLSGGNSGSGGGSQSLQSVGSAPEQWSRWEAGEAASGLAPVTFVAPGLEQIAGSGILYSADQLAQLEAYMARQAGVR
ncbi:hypothetical protein [Alteraurantiacibacter palmitatis]|uniref:DUF3739 domain-containing protein n=1 Tax=Alteraurantiacibacter palmitatis TaxID=2054628 RepID=A0ABV7E5V7_9SPHN